MLNSEDTTPEQKCSLPYDSQDGKMLSLAHSLAHSNLRMSRTSDALSSWYSHPSVAPVAESEQPQQRAPNPQHRHLLSTLSYAESEPADDGEHVGNDLDDSADAHLQALGSARSASDSQFPPAPVENVVEAGVDPLPNTMLGTGSRRGSRISNRLQIPDLRIHQFGVGGGKVNGMTRSHKLRQNSISESLSPEDIKISRRKRTGSLVPQSAAAIVQFFKRPSSRQSSPDKTRIESSKETRSCATQTLESAFIAVQATQKHSACQTELSVECIHCISRQPADGGVNKAPDLQMADSMCESMCSAKSVSESQEPSSPTTAYPVFIVTASSGSPSPKSASQSPLHQLTEPSALPEQHHQQQSALPFAQQPTPEANFSSRSESFSSGSSACDRRNKSKSSRSRKLSHSRANSDCEPPIVLGMVSTDFDVCLLHLITSYSFLRSGARVRVHSSSHSRREFKSRRASYSFH